MRKPLARICVALLLSSAALAAQDADVGPVDYLRLALEARERGEFDAAILELESALTFFDGGNAAHAANRAVLLNELAVVQRSAGNHEEARAAANEAVRLGDEADAPLNRRAIYLLNRGNSALDLGEYAAARQDYRSAVRLAAEAGEAAGAVGLQASLSLGQVHMRLGYLGEAVKTLESALAQARGADAAGADRMAETLAEAHLALRDARSARAALSRLAGPPKPRQQVLEARVLIQEGKFDEAESLLNFSLNRLESNQSATAGSAMYNLAEIEFMRGRYSESAILNDRAERIFAAEFGVRHYSVAQTTHRRALIDQEIGDYAAADERYRMAISILSENFSGDHPLVLSTKLERSRLYSFVERHEQAIATARSVLDAAEASDRDVEYETLLARAALGLARFAAGDLEDARRELETVRRIRATNSFPPTDEPPGLNALAEVYLIEGRIEDAVRHAQRAIQIQRRSGLRGVDTIGESMRVLASAERARGQVEEALRLAQMNSRRIGKRVRQLAKVPSYTAEFAPFAMRRQIAQHLDLLWESSMGAPDADVAREMFEVAQYVHLNETTQATNGFIRNSLRDDSAGLLLLERHQLWQELKALSNLAVEERSSEGIIERRVDAEEGIALLDRRLASEFPQLNELLSPTAVGVAAVQSALREREALWMQVTFERATYLFLLTSQHIMVARTDMDQASLQRLVSAVRSSVDVRTFPELPPFAFAESAEIYEGLFEPFGGELREVERLIVVPDMSAQQLSLATLVSSDPHRSPGFGAGHPEYRFLGLTHGISVMPSPQSFLRLGSRRIDAHTEDGFVGFGDPILSGTGTGNARRAIDRGSGLAKPDVLAGSFEPLPETADELRELASSSSHVRLFVGDQAREAIFKSLNLGDIRTLVFATHAVVAGDFDHLSEPALVLTPPDLATRNDDGLLTASEIAATSVGADIVILSACNTGSTSGRPGAAGLSGLASGFFEAGVGSLLVSHWTILSASSLIIIPQFYRNLSSGIEASPSLALRAAMRGAANNADIPLLQHPALWAPFTVVGAR